MVIILNAADDFYPGDDTDSYSEVAEGEADEMFDEIIRRIDDSLADVPCICNRGDCDTPPSKELADRFEKVKPIFKKLAEDQKRS